MVRISKLALSIMLLLSVPSWAMNQEYTKAANQEQEFYKKSDENYWKTTGMLSKDEYNRYMEKSSAEKTAREERMKARQDRYNAQTPIIKEPTEVPKNPVKFPKIPTPNHITILSKEVAKDKIAAFKAMMNATPAIIVVKDLETLKNPDIKKIREIGNYTLFGDSLNHKWVVDNETGIDVALSQEMIEKVMQLSTENIEFMLENNAFNEKSIDNILEWMNKNQ